jgi:hypothetical protein
MRPGRGYDGKGGGRLGCEILVCINGRVYVMGRGWLEEVGLQEYVQDMSPGHYGGCDQRGFSVFYRIVCTWRLWIYL